jgi:hypothetical protein
VKSKVRILVWDITPFIKCQGRYTCGILIPASDKNACNYLINY